MQDALDKIPESDIPVVLGDFNARVGVLDQDSNLWRGILGRHGMSGHSLAGNELLEFCAINNLSIMSTWFQKKEINQGTWTHPATKRCHTVDFFMMKAEQRVHCKDWTCRVAKEPEADQCERWSCKVRQHYEITTDACWKKTIQDKH